MNTTRFKRGHFRTFRRSQLKRMTKLQLLDVYSRYIDDNMSPVMWNKGLTKLSVWN